MATSAPDDWEELRQSLDNLQNAVNRSKAVNVNTNSLRDAARRLVQHYFRLARPDLQALGIDTEELNGIDSEMQSLLGLANGRNAKRSYLATLRKIRESLDRIELSRELHLGQAASADSNQVPESAIEIRIAETLSELVPSAALSYEQALRDLQSADRLSYRGTANELRETLRETLDHLAPDKDVKEAPGFKLEKNQHKPTQKQKVRHILRSRGRNETARKAPEESALLVEERTASVTRASYERGSLSAHIASSARDVRQLKMYVDSVLAELLEIHA
jgi:hypothetical protein